MTAGARSDAIAGAISAVSVAHDVADVATIERAAVPDPSREVERLLEHDAVREAFVLQTCNRAERYVVAADHAVGRAVLEDRVDEIPADARRTFAHDDAVDHLLRVGAGLESMVLGEDQILGQLRDAIEAADEVGGIGDLLDPTVWKAVHLGERVRTTTAINDGIRSVSRAAVELARGHVDLADADVLVVGAGEMAGRTVEAIADVGGQVTIANRSTDRAKTLATTVDVPTEVVRLSALADVLSNVEVAFTATGSQDPLVTRADVEDVEELTIVDIGQPRDVDPSVGASDGVRTFDLDDLEAITTATSRSREDAVASVESMIANERAQLQRQFKRKQADDVIAAMYAQAERIKHEELAEARAQLSRNRELTEREEDVLAAFADALVGQLMAAPTRSLRQAAAEDDWETIQTALGLFDPEFQSGQARLEDGVGEAADGASVRQEHGD